MLGANIHGESPVSGMTSIICSCVFMVNVPVYFANCLRMDCSSARRLAVVFGYADFSSLSVPRTIAEIITRAFSLSSAGTAYHGTCCVLVASRHSTYSLM